MKSQIILTTLFAASSLATVQSFHLPNNGKPSSNPSSASSLPKKDGVNNDIASRYAGFASQQLNSKKDSSDIASRYMRFATPTPKQDRKPVVSTWKKADSPQEASRSSTSTKSTDFLNFDISSSNDQGAAIQNAYRRAAKATSHKKSADVHENYQVTMAVIEEWSTALNELEDLQEEARRGQQVYSYTTDIYNFEDSWQ